MKSFNPTPMLLVVLCALLVLPATAATEGGAVAATTTISRHLRVLKGSGKVQARESKQKKAVSASEDFGSMTMPEEDSIDDIPVEGSGDDLEEPNVGAEIDTTNTTDIDGDNDVDTGTNTGADTDNGAASEADVETETDNFPDFSLRTEMDLNFILEFGLFDDVELREPTEEEIDGLMEATELFYTNWLSNSSNSNITDYSLNSFTITSRVASFIEEDLVYPILIECAANLKFAFTGDNNELDEEDVLAAMELVY